MRGFAYISKGHADWIDKERPCAKEHDAIVKPIMLSPCTSDVHNVEFGYVNSGRILGHEGIGEVIEVGSHIRDFRPGDIVAIPAVTPDFGTLLSQKGIPQHCNGPMTGNLISNRIDGLMAEYCLIPNADMNLALIPKEVSYSSAVMAVDMMCTGFFGAEQANIQYGDTVAVIGIGPVGLMAVAGAHLKGAGRIIAVGSRPVCVDAAKYYGATEIINYKDGDVAKQIIELTGRQGVDCCIIAGGGENALNHALQITRFGGTISNINYFTTTGNISFSNPKWGFGMSNKTITCGLTPGGRGRLESLLSMIKYHRIDLDPLVTHRLSGFDNIKSSFELMSKKPEDLIKVCVSL